jgi:hypothetical protein
MPLQPIDYQRPSPGAGSTNREYIAALATASLVHALAAACLAAAAGGVPLTIDGLAAFCLCTYVALICLCLLVARSMPSPAVWPLTKIGSVLLLPAFPLGTVLGIHGLINMGRGGRSLGEARGTPAALPSRSTVRGAAKRETCCERLP